MAWIPSMKKSSRTVICDASMEMVDSISLIITNFVVNWKETEDLIVESVQKLDLILLLIKLSQLVTFSGYVTTVRFHAN